MTGLDLSVDEELSHAFEPCLKLKLDTGEARSAFIQSAHEFVGFAPNLVKVLYLQRDE